MSEKRLIPLTTAHDRQAVYDIELEDFVRYTFHHDGKSFPVYRQGQGPAVVVIHEVPGITPAVADYARRVAAAGFTAIMPSLFGEPGRDYEPAYIASSIAKACIRSEFAAFAARQSSPVTDWLRALCRAVHAECGGRGVGTVGMCFTGNFSLSLMVDPVVMAPVLSQPSLPIGISKTARAALHVSDAELQVIKQRIAEEDIRVLGLRFTWDAMCPKARFDHLREELGDGFEAIEIDSSPLNRYRIPVYAHSVLTKDLVDKAGHPTQQALERTLAFFRERLLPVKA
ncbi:MAG: dienelactone hydrolase family protein [Moraxellaceae bacterium]|nr:dienelactone hydrolase family protein [Moraxellaceae bacterium]